MEDFSSQCVLPSIQPRQVQCAEIPFWGSCHPLTTSRQACALQPLPPNSISSQDGHRATVLPLGHHLTAWSDLSLSDQATLAFLLFPQSTISQPSPQIRHSLFSLLWEDLKLSREWTYYLSSFKENYFREKKIWKLESICRNLIWFLSFLSPLKPASVFSEKCRLPTELVIKISQ